jgi:hypothetical protein
MQGLRIVDLTHTKVTAAGLERLRRLRPDIRVEEMKWGCPRGVTARIP